MQNLYCMVIFMSIGISTACFYPQLTENSFLKIGKNGGGVTEIFFNSQSELEKDFIDNLYEIKQKYGISVKSIHPFESFGESYHLFSEYERRFYDGVKDLERYFYAAKKLGADFFVMHGLKKPGKIEDCEYFKRFEYIYDVLNEHGITLLQENVVDFRSQSPEFLLSMRDYMGDKFKMVLDIKQAHLAGFNAMDFAEKLSNSIVHFHISDYSDEKSCITPLKGKFDFNQLFNQMSKKGYNGDYIIELYKNSFNNESEIFNAKSLLTDMLNLNY